MKKLTILLMVAGVVGCSTGEQEGSNVQTGTQAQAPASDVPLVLGTLSYEGMEQVSAAVDPFHPWDQAFRQALTLVGEPTRAEGNDHFWTLMHGDMCAELRMENRGGEVGIVGIVEYSDFMPEQFARCQGVPRPGNDSPAQPPISPGPDEGTLPGTGEGVAPGLQ